MKNQSKKEKENKTKKTIAEIIQAHLSAPTILEKKQIQAKYFKFLNKKAESYILRHYNESLTKEESEDCAVGYIYTFFEIKVYKYDRNKDLSEGEGFFYKLLRNYCYDTELKKTYTESLYGYNRATKIENIDKYSEVEYYRDEAIGFEYEILEAFDEQLKTTNKKYSLVWISYNDNYSNTAIADKLNANCQTGKERINRKDIPKIIQEIEEEFYKFCQRYIH